MATWEPVVDRDEIERRKRLGIKGGANIVEPIIDYNSFNLDDNDNLTVIYIYINKNYFQEIKWRKQFQIQNYLFSENFYTIYICLKICIQNCRVHSAPLMSQESFNVEMIRKYQDITDLKNKY